MTNSLLFSVVIPTLNEEKFLPLLLKDLAAQSYRNFEVIVADGKSKDKTVDKAESYANKLNLNILTTPKANISLQRNLGAKAAKATWILFADADNRLPTYFLQGLAYQLELHFKTQVFTTWMDHNLYTNSEEKFIARAYNIGLSFYKLIQKPTAVGALIGIKRTIFHKYRFDEDLKIFEDHDLITRCHKAKLVFSIFPEPQYYYSFRRFRREGTLKMLGLFASINIKSLLGGDTSVFEQEYPMLGGEYHLTPATNETEAFYFFSNMAKFLPKASTKQLKRFKNMMFYILDI